VLKSGEVAELIDHIVQPHKKTVEPAPGSAPSPASDEAAAEAGSDQEQTDADQAPARARAIFHAAEELKPFDPADLSFAFDEDAGLDFPAGAGEASTSQPGGGLRFGGLSVGQWAVLALMLLAEVGIVGALVYLVYFNAP